MSNPFADYAASRAYVPRCRQAQGAAQRETTEDKRLQAVLKEERVLAKMYSRWMKCRQRALLEGPHGEQIKALNKLLRTMTLASAPTLLAWIERASWLRKADPDTRFNVLDIVSHAITNLRLRNGLAPFDDPIPFTDEPDNAFMIIREFLK